MLAFLTGLFQRMRSGTAPSIHRGLPHEEGISRIRMVVVSEQVRAAVVGQNSARHAFVTAVPDTTQTNGTKPSVRSQLKQILAAASEAMARDDVACATPIYLNLFVSDIGQIETCRQLVRDFYGEQLPVTTYIPQTPCDGSLVTLELMSTDEHAEVTRRDAQTLIEEHDGVTWVHCAQIKPERAPAGAYDRSYSAFLQLRNLTVRENLKVSDVIRTWLYQGDIVGPEYDTQRYKELNRARTDFFDGTDFIQHLRPSVYEGTIFPASTGIGGDDADIVMSSLAIKTDRDDVIAVPLENPDQTSAFDYAKRFSPESPKFARAMAVAVGNQTSTIFVSGTASITGSESRHIEDVAAQTHQTIDNIAVLIDRENMTRHGIHGMGATVRDMAVVKAYVKRPKDYETVRAICEERFGTETPIIYTVADVCREELLVEIEGIVFPRLFLERTTLIQDGVHVAE